MTKIGPVTILNLVIPKVGVKHELLFNKQASEAANVRLFWKRLTLENTLIKYKADLVTTVKILIVQELW